jgi:peptide deformylase
MIDINEVGLELVNENNSILTQMGDDFDFQNPLIDPKELAQKLHFQMIRNDGLGISACQIGIPLRVFALRIEANEPFVLFNPRIVNVSEKEISMKEGCLSFPLLFLSVKRPDAVRLRYQTETGETVTNQFIGMTARICLHEMDHMNGKVFTSRASSYESQRALRKRMILKRKVK